MDAITIKMIAGRATKGNPEPTQFQPRVFVAHNSFPGAGLYKPSSAASLSNVFINHFSTYTSF